MTNKVIHQILDIEDDEDLIDDIDDDEDDQLPAVVQPTIHDLVPFPEEPAEEPDVKRMDQDFNESIDNLKEVISTAKTALELALTVAQDKEDHNSFNAVNNLLKNITDTAKSLVELHNKKVEFKEKHRKLKAPEEHKTGPSGGDNGNINIKNAVFTGSPSQFRDFIEKKRNGGQ